MSFTDPDVVAGYADRTARMVPGLSDLYRMTGLLLSEKVPADARILVLGAGGGLELRALARSHPGWRFWGVDPSAEMLARARTALGQLVERVEFVAGYIDDAPDGPFDGAVCLLTLHFLEERERIRTVTRVHDRLRPGAPFIVAHHSYPRDPAGRDRWLRRNAAFGADGTMTAAEMDRNVAAMKDRLPALAPEEDVAVLEAGGFSSVELFYAGFTFKGWVAERT